jgi:hypothetical protein
MPQVKTGDRIVVQVTENGNGNWQVEGAPVGFQTISAALFSDNDLIHGFLLHENDEDWEVYDGDEAGDFLQILNVASPVILQRPATPHDSSNSGNRLSNTDTGTHTLAIEIGAATLARVFRETNPSVLTFTGGDATPSVEGYRYCKTQGSTSITSFDNMAKGHFFLIAKGDSDIAITNNASIQTLTGADFYLTNDSPYAWFVEEGGVAKQVSGFDSKSSPNFKPSSELTISGGSITLSGPSHTIDTESDASSDDLTDVVWWDGAPDGAECSVRNEDESRVLNFIHNDSSGKLVVSGGRDKELSDKGTIVLLKKAGDRTLASFGGGSGGNLSDVSNQISFVQLLDISDPINTSEKLLGKMVLETTNNRVYVALGSAAGDSWRPMDDQSGISDETPS